MGLYELWVKKSALEAATQLGIALIFDPFDQNQPWKERPQWQKAILIIHLDGRSIRLRSGIQGFLERNGRRLERKMT